MVPVEKSRGAIHPLARAVSDVENTIVRRIVHRRRTERDTREKARVCLRCDSTRAGADVRMRVDESGHDVLACHIDALYIRTVADVVASSDIRDAIAVDQNCRIRDHLVPVHGDHRRAYESKLSSRFICRGRESYWHAFDLVILREGRGIHRLERECR